jgi:uncharacterized protein YggE
MRSFLVIVAITALQGYAVAQKNFLDQNYIEVQGKATVKVAPDQIYMRVQISEKQKYRSDMEAKERKMLDDLKTIGIPESDIVIKDMASNFRSRVFADDNIVISKVYLVLVHDAKTANRVISNMEKLEISNIKVDHLDHTKLTDFKKDASVKAMAAAKLKAESLAGAIGQSIGRALCIEEDYSAPLKPVYDNTRFAYKGEVSTSPDYFLTDLDFDEIKIEYIVLAKFELK